MNSLIVKILVFGLIMTANLPVRAIRPEVIVVSASESSAGKNELTLNEGRRVKEDLLELFKLCRAERYSEAAKHLVYRGPDKSREWADVYDYRNPAERREVDSIGRSIKELLKRSDSYQLSRFFEKTEAEGKWRVWEIIFRKGEKSDRVDFAFLKLRSRYALGDIDGHLAYLRLIE